MYIAHATAGETEIAVKLAAIANAPSSYDGWIKKGAHLDQLAENHYEIAIEYGEKTRPEPGDFSFTWDTTGATQKMTQAKENLGNYAPSGSNGQ